MDDKPSQKGAWLRHVTHFNFGGPIHISGMAEARALKFLYKGILYQVLPKRWQITPKKGVVLLTWPIFVCTTVQLEKIIHATRWAAINNVVDNGLLLIAPTALEATPRLRPTFYRFDLSLYLLQSWLYNIYTVDSKSIKWSLSIIVQICDNNRHFLVCIAICYLPTLVAW